MGHNKLLVTECDIRCDPGDGLTQRICHVPKMVYWNVLVVVMLLVYFFYETNVVILVRERCELIYQILCELNLFR